MCVATSAAESRNQQRFAPLPGFSLVTTSIGTAARRSIEGTVGHLDFMHTIDVQLCVDDLARCINNRTMTFAAGHIFIGDMFAVTARHASATGGVT